MGQHACAASWTSPSAAPWLSAGERDQRRTQPVRRQLGDDRGTATYRARLGETSALLCGVADGRFEAIVVDGCVDRGLLHLLGTTGLRRAEAAALLIADIRRAPARRRRAIAQSTPWWVTVRRGKRGRRRRVPPRARRARRPHQLGPRPTHLRTTSCSSRCPAQASHPNRSPSATFTRIVTQYAAAAGLPDDRRSPHVLRHTFCTHLANAGVAIDVIRSSPGTPTFAPARSRLPRGGPQIGHAQQPGVLLTLSARGSPRATLAPRTLRTPSVPSAAARVRSADTCLAIVAGDRPARSSSSR